MFIVNLDNKDHYVAYLKVSSLRVSDSMEIWWERKNLERYRERRRFEYSKLATPCFIAPSAGLICTAVFIFIF